MHKITKRGPVITLLKCLVVAMRHSPWFNYGLLAKLKSRVYAAYFGIPPGTAIHHGCVITSAHLKNSSEFIVGDAVEFAANTHIDITGSLRIGRDVTVSEGAKIYTHTHPLPGRAERWRDVAPIIGNLVIGDDCWIGASAIILGNVRSIGRGAIIGAGAVVTRDVPEYEVYGGVPATRIGVRAGGTHASC